MRNQDTKIPPITRSTLTNEESSDGQDTTTKKTMKEKKRKKTSTHPSSPHFSEPRPLNKKLINIKKKHRESDHEKPKNNHH